MQFHEYQQKVIECDARFVFACAGKRSGKTWVTPFWLWREVIKYPDDNHMIVFPTLKVGEQGAYDIFKRQSLDAKMIEAKNIKVE